MNKDQSADRAFPLSNVQQGLTKLEYAAIAAMQGLIAAGRTESEAIAAEAWIIAEAMFADDQDLD